MKCPMCARAQLVHGTKDLPYTYKGESITLSDVTGYFCPSCGEFILKKDEPVRVGAMMLEFNKKVNARIVDPQFIARVRKQLNLDQQKAGEIFGGGVNAFSLYENGKTKPSLSLVQLLRLLDLRPDLLEEISHAFVSENTVDMDKARAVRRSTKYDMRKVATLRSSAIGKFMFVTKKAATKSSSAKKAKAFVKKVRGTK